MKFLNFGEKSEFDAIELKLAKQQGKFGLMYYFEKIQLSSVNPIADYNTWKNKDGQNFLCVRFEPSVKEELVKIVDAIRKTNNQLVFKELEDSQIFFKIKPEVAAAVPLYQKVNIVIQVYGVFKQKSSDTSYLQMEVVSVIKV